MRAGAGSNPNPDDAFFRCFSQLLILLLACIALPASADVSVDDAGGAMALETGQGRILRFDQNVASVFVANPAIADVQVVSPGVVYLFGKQSGDTNLIALGAEDESQASLRLQVRDGDARASQALREADDDSQVRLHMAGNQLVAEGSSDSVEGAMATQSTLDTQAPGGGSLNNSTYDGANQINIRVRFAEVARDELLSYGVSWNALINNGSFSFGVLTSNIASSPGGEGVDGLLQALQQNNLLQILAEPNITPFPARPRAFWPVARCRFRCRSTAIWWASSTSSSASLC